MKKEEYSKQIAARYPDHILGIEAIRPRRVTIDISPDIIRDIAGYLYSELKFRFIIASALHTRAGIEIHYHFSHDPSGFIYNIHTILDPNQAEIDSLSSLFSGADWIEREMHEILGIVFRGHPKLEKLISEGNWAEGVYPYRKEY
jgi:Ni,Fe-hydrogenase III component G